MAKKLVSTVPPYPKFDWESPLWLGMGTSMGNTQYLKTSIGMGMCIYIPAPYSYLLPYQIWVITKLSLFYVTYIT